MLITSGCAPDVRIEKEAHTLAESGCRVQVIAWDRAGTLPRHATERVGESGLISITRLHIQAGYRTGRPLLLKLPVFWWRAFQELRRFRPQVVHAHDLDTLPLAYLYGRWSGARVIYDAREYYPGMVRDSVGGPLAALLEHLDRWLVPRVDAVLTVGERLADRLRGLGGRVWIVHNSQLLPDPDQIARAGLSIRQTLGVPEGALLVVYVGYLTPDRVLAPLLEAVPRLDRVWFAVGGTGPLLNQVQAAAARCDRIKTLGWIPLAEVQGVVAAGDVVYYGLESHNANSFYFMPNLAFFALAAGRPLLVTPVGEIADVVAREGCGLVLDTASPEAAEWALKQLCDSSTRATLADHAGIIGKSCYNWSHAARQLLDAYSSLSDVRNCQ
jgi:glycosyltransferase involved in cell wall biosynthesis